MDISQYSTDQLTRAQTEAAAYHAQLGGVAATGSMLPLLTEHSILVWMPLTHPDRELHKGDLILFRRRSGAHTVIICHRIISIFWPERIITKGDSLRDVDPLWVLPSDIVGKVVSVVNP